MEQVKTAGYAPINGLNMYYEIHGSGSMPLVLVHGGGSTIQTSFGRVLPFLSAQGKVIAVELQAHGHTSDRNTPETFEQDADDVAALLEHLKVDKANIWGFSNGANTTMQIAIRHPYLVNKIVVTAGSYKRDGFVPGFFDGFATATLANMPEALQAAYLEVAPNKEHLQTMFEKDVARMATFKDWSDDAIRSIKAPALFMVADRDVITVEHTVQMARLVTGAQLTVLPGIHGAFMGAAEANAPKDSKLPKLTAALVAAFLNE